MIFCLLGKEKVFRDGVQNEGAIFSSFLLFSPLLFSANPQRNNVTCQICLLLKQSGMLECLYCNLGSNWQAKFCWVDTKNTHYGNHKNSQVQISSLFLPLEFMMRNELSFFLKVPAIVQLETWGTTCILRGGILIYSSKKCAKNGKSTRSSPDLCRLDICGLHFEGDLSDA